MQKQIGTLDVAQEAGPQPLPLTGTSDQAGDISYHQGFVTTIPHYPQIGYQGGKGIISNLGAGGRNGGNQGRLAGIGKTNQADIGKELQLQAQGFFVPGDARLGMTRGAVSAGGKTGIAAPSLTALDQQEFGVLAGQISQDFTAGVIVDQGSRRHPQLQTLTTFAMHIFAHPRRTVLRAIMAHITIIKQGRKAPIDDKNHISATTAIAAIGAALGNKLLAPE